MQIIIKNQERAGTMIEEIIEVTDEETEYKTRMKELQKELGCGAELLMQKKVPLIVVFEGLDASGKSGCIRRLTRELDPKQYKVIPISAPTEEEKRYHYLHRFWKNLPPAGNIAFFDRSWYGRVLVERVEGFCPEEEWRRAYREINEFERQLADGGALILKFWLEVSEEEQLVRFKKRMENPEKAHKITDEDWRNRAKREEYNSARDDMFRMTDTEYAKWKAIPADNKKPVRLFVAEEIIYYINLLK
ncbi:MAG: hypothetical protein E7627_04600 [Ruminococcaceae bacterium]|nr:hypothetical protein [Oscillospiraceae bacterium]